MAQPSVITRYAPSPTGPLHVGGVRTALFNYLFTKKEGGKIILRFEDTDKARSKKEYETNIFESMEWLGLTYDAIYKQSERTLVYRKYLEQMIKDGTAYISNEVATVKDDGEGEEEEDVSGERRSEVIRFKNPNTRVTFSDIALGEISVEVAELKDFIIAKSLDEPLYHFAVVVDDFEMGVTHVIRGADGVYNTPRQILIQEAIKAPRPKYCHIPFVLGPDKAKLSKRNGSVSVTEYRDLGYLPGALINYLALLGWHPEDEREIFTMEELIDTFDITKVQKSGAIFDIEKLRWINREHIKKMSDTEFKKIVTEWFPKDIKNLPQWTEERLDRILPEIKDRISTFGEVRTLAASGEFDYMFDAPVYDAGLLIPTSKNDSAPEKTTIEKHLAWVANKLTALNAESFTKDGVKDALWEYATKEGRGDVLWPMRIALSGRDKSPDPFTLSSLFGKEETLSRISGAITKLRT